MDKLPKSIALIPLPGGEEAALLRENLEKLGYSVTPRDPDWDPAETREQVSPAVLFLGRGADLSSQTEACLKRFHSLPHLVVFTEAGELIQSSLVRFCSDFLTWPCGLQELSLRLDRMMAGLAARRIEAGATDYDEFANMNLSGRSPAFLSVLHSIRIYSRCPAPVLIRGATGTGKERVARAIHYLGSRRDNPFVPVNCGAIPDSLIENELFGHEKGAYTDAMTSHLGLVAEANGGTLFLDEVDALSTKAQVTLLRFLEDLEYRPLGGTGSRRADVRFIAAASANLPNRLASGNFRQDLLFRLDILPLCLPPLAQRQGDIPVLARHFLRHYSHHYGIRTKNLHPQAMALLDSYNWPGNVRELQNTIHRALLISGGPTIQPADLQIQNELPNSPPSREPGRFQDVHFAVAKAEAIARFENRYLNWLMRETRGNVTKAAQRAGKERRSLGKLLKKHGIEREPFALD